MITIYTVSSGAGHRPEQLTDKGNHGDEVRKPFRLPGGITVCPHGTVVREGYEGLSLELTGQQLINVAIAQPGATIFRSSLPAQCEQCKPDQLPAVMEKLAGAEPPRPVLNPYYNH